jgi:hypothetical protein
MKDTKTKQLLPKWFTDSGGMLYTDGDTVYNQFTERSVDLTAAELSMYDYIKGAEVMAFSMNDADLIKNFNKAIRWFRKENVDAYYILLD